MHSILARNCCCQQHPQQGQHQQDGPHEAPAGMALETALLARCKHKRLGFGMGQFIIFGEWGKHSGGRDRP